MDPTTPRHPDEDTLKKLMTGRLDDDAAREVEAHLESGCTDCWERIKAFPKDAQLDSIYDLIQHASAVPEPSIPTPEERPYRFTVVGLHAKGGIGQVYVARDTDLDREVALKQMRPERAVNPRNLARFLREARITGQLEHPGIVPIYELGTRPDNRQPYYAMRFVHGRTLAEAIRDFHAAASFDSRTFRELLQRFVSVCQTIAYAHSKGVIHRDLKPANIVLGDFGEVIVLDWGLAKVIAERDRPTLDVTEDLGHTTLLLSPSDFADRSSIPGQVSGTPNYMAPEQAAGDHDRVDARTDVYALGAILYELLTGRPPFAGADVQDILRQARESRPRPARAIAPQAPPALEAICHHALSRDPRERYSSARDLAEDVRRWLADEPVAAFRDSALTRLGRWARRHRQTVTALVVLLLSAVAALAITTYLVSEQERETEAEKQRADRNFRLALDAVDQSFTRISEHELLKAPGTQKLRKDLLESAREFYQRFVEENEQSPDLLSELGRSWHRLGTITSEIDAPQKARAHLEQARELQEEIVRRSPTFPEARNDLADTLHDLGVIHKRAGDLAEAERFFLRALGVFDQLARETVGDDRLRHQLRVAICWDGLGSIHDSRGERAKAIDAFQKALMLREPALDSARFKTVGQGQFGISCFQLGSCHFKAGEAEKAQDLYEKALAVFEQLLALHGTQSQRWQECLGKTHANLGMVQEATGHLARARSEHLQAIRIREKLERENPDVVEYRSDLAHSLNSLFKVHFAEGKLGQAEAVCRRALEIRASLARAQAQAVLPRRDLAESHHNLAIVLQELDLSMDVTTHFEKAVELLRRLVADQPEVPEWRMELAATLHDRGDMRGEEGEDDLRGCLRLRQQLAKDHPQETAYQEAVAQSQTSLARLLMDRPARAAQEEAKTFLLKAIDTRERVTHPEPKTRADLGGAYATLGVLQTNSGQWNEATEAFAQAVAILERLIKEQPELPSVSARLALTLGNRANLWYRLGKAEESLQDADRALRLLEPLAEYRPTERRRLLGRMHQQRGSALIRHERFREATQALDKAIALLEGPVKLEMEVLRAWTRVRSGDYRQGTSEADELARRPELVGSAWFNLACTYSRAVARARTDPNLPSADQAELVKQWSDAAIQALKAAHAKGFFSPPDGIRHWQDPDLHPIEPDERFKKLKAEALVK